MSKEKSIFTTDLIVDLKSIDPIIGCQTKFQSKLMFVRKKSNSLKTYGKRNQMKLKPKKSFEVIYRLLRGKRLRNEKNIFIFNQNN